MAELEFASEEKKYQDMVLAIIRELEKIDTCSFQACDTNLKIIPCGFKSLIIDLLKLIKRTLIYFNISEKLMVKLLEIINPLLTKLESPKIIAYNYYFLGCFYYKINDHFTAIDYLKKCRNLTPDPNIEKSASKILDNIWNNKVRPSIWKWWLDSPSHTWFRRASFLILVSSLFGILLPFQASELLTLLPSKTSELFAGSFFSIDWNKSATPLTFVTLIIIFILASPIIQHFKGSQIEIEVRPPPAFELTPSLIEKKLKDLEYISRL